MAAPQYTTCVEPQNYQELNLTAEMIAAAVILVTTIPLGPVAVLAALPLALPLVISAMLKICDYLLHGKLVCLDGGPDVCAIGRVTGFETVADKDDVDKLDNDFSINLMLAPHRLEDFATGGDKKANWDFAKTGPQGKLITELPDMPIPREPNASGGFSNTYRPTSTTFQDAANPSFQFLTTPPAGAVPFEVPDFHCEIEGNRIVTVCKTLSTISSLGIPGLCKVKIFGIPVGRVLCAIIGAILSPILAAAIVTAWIAGSDDNRDFDNAGDRKRGDCLLIIGRWCYDAGHAGWNESHAVKRVQLLPDDVHERFTELFPRWDGQCRRVPPDPVEGRKPEGMTPEQEDTWDAQVDPVNRWVFHPIVDGCEEVPVIR